MKASVLNNKKAVNKTYVKPRKGGTLRQPKVNPN